MAGIQKFLEEWFYLYLLQSMYSRPIFSLSSTLFPPSRFLLPTPCPIVYEPLFLHQCLIIPYGLSDTLLLFFARLMCKCHYCFFIFIFEWAHPCCIITISLPNCGPYIARLIPLLRPGQSLNEFEVDWNVYIMHSTSNPSLVLCQLPYLVSLNLLLLEQSQLKTNVSSPSHRPFIVPGRHTLSTVHTNVRVLDFELKNWLSRPQSRRHPKLRATSI